MILRVYPLSTHAKFSERLTFPTPWYAHVRVRIRGLEKLVFRNILRTYLINGWPLTHKNYFFPMHLQNRCDLYKSKFRQVSSCYNNVLKSWIFPANTPCVFHVETTWKRWFPRRFNLELSLSFSKNLVLVIFDGWKIVFSKNSNLPYLLLWWFWVLFLCIWLGKIVCWNLFWGFKPCKHR